MQFSRCKCGHVKRWSSGMHVPCTRCPKCGSDLAAGPTLHKEPPEPHKFVETKVKTDAGEQALTRCYYCSRTKEDIDAEKVQFPILADKEVTT